MSSALETFQPVWASGGLAARDSNVSLVVDSVQLLFISCLLLYASDEEKYSQQSGDSVG